MNKVRIIPRLDVKGPNVVKGIQFEGLRVVGNPAEFAKRYFLNGADEIIYIDIVASLYGRNNLAHIVEETIERDVFIPITVGGGIRSLEDINKILRSGADKVAINTAGVRNPKLLSEAVRVFGSSTIVLSIEAKKVNSKQWEVYIDNGREKTDLDVVEWVKMAAGFGIGEILITSVDRDGTRSGYDLDLINTITDVSSVPVIASGGAGNIKHLESVIENNKVNGIAIASMLHYNELTIESIKEKLSIKNKDRINYHNNHTIDLSLKTNAEVSIVDYNLGNLRSVKNAFRQLGASVKIIETPKEVIEAEYLVLPGVGSFGEGMNNLKIKELDKAIVEYSHSGKPLLGICLGQQLLMTKSYEFGEYYGLNLIKGVVLPFPENNELKIDGYKVPHVGWNTVYGANKWEETILDSIDNMDAYFVHSYYVIPDNEKNVLAKTNYYDYEFCSVVYDQNIYGCQFHPEKSGNMGLSILRNFLNKKN